MSVQGERRIDAAQRARFPATSWLRLTIASSCFVGGGDRNLSEMLWLHYLRLCLDPRRLASASATPSV